MNKEPTMTEANDKRVKLPAEHGPGHASMATAPQDGRYIVLVFADDTACRAYWRTTRSFDPPSGLWKPTRFWAAAEGNQRFKAEPVGWRKDV